MSWVEPYWLVPAVGCHQLMAFFNGKLTRSPKRLLTIVANSSHYLLCLLDFGLMLAIVADLFITIQPEFSKLDF